MKVLNVGGLAQEIHRSNVRSGWWDGFENKVDRHETAMMLVVSEMSEAMEGFRKDLMDDHLPKYKMFDVELADTMIRLLDLAGAYEINPGTIYNKPLPESVPDQLYAAVKYIVKGKSRAGQVANGVAIIIAIAEKNNVDLWALIFEKRVYNATRADHKLTARNAPGGKKF